MRCCVDRSFAVAGVPWANLLPVASPWQPTVVRARFLVMVPQGVVKPNRREQPGMVRNTIQEYPQPCPHPTFSGSHRDTTGQSPKRKASLCTTGWPGPRQTGNDMGVPFCYHAAMLNERHCPCPPHYTTAIRILLRYALVLLVVSLLAGVAFQESVKKLSLTPGPGGLGYFEATLHLALVHGHLMVTGVLLPVAMAGMLHLARAHGGSEVGPRALRWVVYTYLPFVTVTVGLMLYKGYHVLLAARAGETDLARIDATLFAGSKALRHALYGLSHVGMSFGLCLFAWCVWRSLRVKPT